MRYLLEFADERLREADATTARNWVNRSRLEPSPWKGWPSIWQLQPRSRHSYWIGLRNVSATSRHCSVSSPNPMPSTGADLPHLVPGEGPLVSV
jgi:hypothetical protein